jgi:hypothetical protein
MAKWFSIGALRQVAPGITREAVLFRHLGVGERAGTLFQCQVDLNHGDTEYTEMNLLFSVRPPCLPSFRGSKAKAVHQKGPATVLIP